jgi:hypothetical protein
LHGSKEKEKEEIVGKIVLPTDQLVKSPALGGGFFLRLKYDKINFGNLFLC